MAESQRPWRAELYGKHVYVIRDVMADNGKLDRCEYLTRAGDRAVWRPCVEGVQFADIQPLVTING